MIAKNSEYLAEASQMLYELNTDDIEWQKCRAREDYYRLQDMMQKEKEKAVREKEKQSVFQCRAGTVVQGISYKGKAGIKSLIIYKNRLQRN